MFHTGIHACLGLLCECFTCLDGGELANNSGEKWHFYSIGLINKFTKSS